MKLALDTNAYSDFFRDDAAVVAAVQRATAIALPLMVLAELRAGFEVGTASKKNEAMLQRFLNQPEVQLLLPDEQTSFHYARLYAQLRLEGTPIPSNDLWIAALVLQHGCILLTRDRHFGHLPQLPRWKV